MKNLLIGTFLLSLSAASVANCEKNFPSFDPNFPPPDGFIERFELSQSYPNMYSENEDFPWLKVNPFKSPEEYMQVVLAYSLEGNIEVNFRGQLNKIRKWYHAPWLHDDGRLGANQPRPGNGREYINGLTRERGTPKLEIHRLQDVELENWAVGMYNAPGGYTLGKVWCSDNGIPNLDINNESTKFPEGTVSFKLLFTDGTIDKVPFLENTLQWDANIYKCNPRRKECQDRVNRKVNLIQIDIAIKDSRAKKSGWFFGTFVYDASSEGKTVWERMIPVGLSWGNDQTIFTDLNKDGAFINADLEETWLNENLLEHNVRVKNGAYVLYHGVGGRLNGPVDNPISSCVSCHGQAAVTNTGRPMPMADFGALRHNYPMLDFIKYFSNVRPGTYRRFVDGETYVTTDYSLQLSAGIRNFYELKRQNETNKSNKAQLEYLSPLSTETMDSNKALPNVTRGE
ncbi:conserved exported hypothetical protein [Vibrio jasicida]|uniref:hypothetical protein n=1 Tax=Vibrio jasicida TaxID=766224 RepID=UPI002894C5DC|nr:conserved exported hypothetical protein [Vibrio jasicida]